MTSPKPEPQEEEKPKENHTKASSWLADFRGAIYDHYADQEAEERRDQAKQQERQRKAQKEADKHIKLGAMGKVIDWIAEQFDDTTPIYQWKKLAYRSGEPNIKLGDAIRGMENHLSQEGNDVKAPTISPQAAARQFVTELENLEQEMGIANAPQVAKASAQAQSVADKMKKSLGDGSRSQTPSPTPAVKPTRAQDKPHNLPD